MVGTPWLDLMNQQLVVYDDGETFAQLLTTAKKIAGLATADYVKAVQELLQGRAISDPIDWGHINHNSTSIDFQKLYRLVDAIREGARLLDLKNMDPNFQQFAEIITANGAAPLIRSLNLIATGAFDSALARRAQNVLATIRELLGRNTPELIANDTSDKLTAFFVDGTYNFTYILFPSVVLQNGAAGSGTCVISSNYDVNTKLLDKKSLINNFLDPLPQTILQSFDIHSNSIVMDTYGTSLSGKFGIKEDGSALNTVETGYDATYGTFTKFHKFYIKTQIGFLISNYNKDTDELHSVWFYSIVPNATQTPEPLPGVKP